MNPVLSQLLGLVLALNTAIGCIVYERLVNAYSLGIIVLFHVLFYVPFLIIWSICYGGQFKQEIVSCLSSHPWGSFIYWITFITTPLWYFVTKKQGVMVSSLYEVKYIVILALVYIFFGSNKFTMNTGIGLCFALTSVYFISRK